MAIRMKDKYDKYWGNMEKINMLIFVAVVLDPRHKLNYVEFALKNMYDSDKGLSMAKMVKEIAFELYHAYNSSLPSDSIQSSMMSDVEKPQQKLKKHMKSLYMMHMIQTCGSNQTSKLDRYLNEDVENDIKNFDILGWWKVNSNKFPILSQLAQYVLDILVSIVSFESSFSTKGHILDSFRNSLTLKVVQALVCTQDWIRESSNQVYMVEKLQELENFENGTNTFFFCLFSCYCYELKICCKCQS